MTAASCPQARPAYIRCLPCTLDNVPTARGFVKGALLTWDLGGLVEAGQLVVTELFGNAIQHTNSLGALVTITRREEQLVRVARWRTSSRTCPHAATQGMATSVGGT